MAAENAYTNLMFVLLSVSLLPLWLQADASGNETDRLSLLKFKQGISSDPYGVFTSWNDSVSFCNWYGIKCGRRHQRVTSLNLTAFNLVGSLSPHIGNLTFLRVLYLKDNFFHGHIPQHFGNLFRLQYFSVYNNSISGEIPTNLSHCYQLRGISLTLNQIQGRIPWEFGRLSKLEIFRLPGNNIRGRIPPSLANLSSLTSFQVDQNYLVGNIPFDMGRLKSLTIFGAAENYLSGTIPTSLFNISSIVIIDTASNQHMYGTIPQTIGLTLPNVQEIYFGDNQFSGFIPFSLSNASSLKICDLSFNKFKGQVPDLTNLPNLEYLDLSENALGFNSSNDLAFLPSLKNSTNLQLLSFSNNNFGGVLPNSLGNVSFVLLNSLYLGGNQFTGIIPSSLENFVNLRALGLESNSFTGSIPAYLGKFQWLQELDFSANKFSGKIPSSMGNLSQLSKLVLSQNQLEGSIPSSIGKCTSLNYLSISHNRLEGHIPQELTQLPSLSLLLNLSHNSLSGNLPDQVGKLININTLDVSENNLSGKIPTTVGGCLTLESLYLQGNSFQGVIPTSLASLRGLQHLDLSRNNLTREIPEDLHNLPFLQYLNLSFNDLEGNVPTQGVFNNATALSLIGNAKLCGGIPVLLLPKCPTKVMKHGMSLALKIMIIAICAVFGVSFLVAFLFAYRKRKSTVSSAAPLLMDPYVRVSYQDLYNATSGFSSKHLIGSGNFGSVYKGYLEQIQSPVAIKVLQLQQRHAFKTLMAECNVLKNVRHRNLVKLVSYCSSLDYKGNEFKALIFEFMENGSLDQWLHHDSTSNSEPIGSLNFLQRLNIAIDVASALHYLHDLYESSIIHCDLKPSNVLLDKDMVAHVSDFGLARFLLTNSDASKSQHSSIGIQGTIGYVAPEYAMGSPMSKEGDVYSFGILVLEMFIGKRPTDSMFKEGLNIHNFVKNALPDGVMQIVDQRLITGERVNNNRNQRANEAQSIVSVVEVGVRCSMESPEERSKMGEVAKQLHFIRSSYLGVHVYEI